MNIICTRCHRSLKNPESMAKGYGPTCLKKVLKEIEEQKNESDSDAATE